MNKLRIIPLGGMGNVTKNMYVYEYGNEILLVDCGIGFPELNMHGIDLLIPDITYVKEQVEAGKKIVGMILTHGHDDHIAATGYIIPELPDFPIYASPLTAAFAEQRMGDHGLQKTVNVVRERIPFRLGVFEIEAMIMTHSVPDTRHYLIRTPEGNIYHGTDFKIDLTPVDGILPDFDRITSVGKEGVMCMLMDCLRVERPGFTASESTVRQALEREMYGVKGKVIVTLMSSHLHRVQQAVDVAIEMGRKVAFIGRSVEQNVEIALQLKKLDIPRKEIVSKREIEKYADNKLCLFVAGSQGQEGSSLIRAIFGEHPQLRISKSDAVIFSADVIPGNEQAFYGAIDELSRTGVKVSYPDIADDLHVSGHAAATEQQLLIAMVRPQYLFPIGGANRHRNLFKDLAENMGYKASEVVLPSDGQVVEFSNGVYNKGEKLILRDLMVDGKGVGDIGTVVLADRKVMSQDGMIVVVLPTYKDQIDFSKIEIISRGFVFMKDAQPLIEEIKLLIKDIVEEALKQDASREEIKKKLEKKLTKELDKATGRTPLVLPVFMEMG